MKAALCTIALTILPRSLPCRGQPASRSLEKHVAVLIGKMVNRTTEHQAFADLEALGCPAVPIIIKQMDDRRNLPDHSITLTNKFPQAFEPQRFYGPEKVVDALAAILNQMTGEDFGDIFNGGTDAEQTKTVQGWRDFEHKTPVTKLCNGW